MIENYKVITLCGSTKFKKEFMRVQKDLTLQGNIIISVGLFGHADGDYQTVLTDEIKVMLDDMHKRKIDLADEIFVINVNGYIGSSTRSEIDYAITTNKKVNYLEDNELNNFMNTINNITETTADRGHVIGESMKNIMKSN